MLYLSLLKTYYLMSIRRLARERVYLGIYAFSLAIGMAAILAIGQYAYYELSYNRHLQHFDNIHLLYSERVSNNELEKDAFSPFNLGEQLVEDYPQIGISTAFIRNNTTIRRGDMLKEWSDVFFASDSVFDVFTPLVLFGNPATAFTDNNSIAISESFAQYYFGRADVIGESLEHNSTQVRVSLVFEDLPANSTVNYQALLPMALAIPDRPMLDEQVIEFRLATAVTFLKLNSDFERSQFSSLMQDFITRHRQDEEIERRPIDFRLRSLADLHIFSDDISGGFDHSNATRFFSLLGIGFCIVIIACVNTLNLNTARLLRRMDEVKTQRLLGAEFATLSIYAITEATTLGLMALVIALALLEFYTLMPVSDILNDSINQITWSGQSSLLACLYGTCLLLSVACVLYPLWRFTRSSESSNFESNKHGKLTSTVLVAFQFLAAIGGLIIGIIFVQQSAFVYKKDIGFDIRDRLVLRFDSPDDIGAIQRIADEIEQQTWLQSLSHNTWTPGRFSIRINSYLPKESGNPENDPERRISVIMADNIFAAAIGLQPIMGQLPMQADDSPQGVVITESIIKLMEWESRDEEEIIGHALQMPGWQGQAKPKIVTAVVRDFHSRSLFEEVLPTIIVPLENDLFPPMFTARTVPHLTLHLKAGYNPTEIVSYLQTLTQRHIPQHTFKYHWLDELWRSNYGDKEKERDQATFFSVIAVVLCLLGLGGLSAYTVEARLKELSIRKIIGASRTQILKVVSARFLWLGLIVSIPAWLLSYAIVDRWLGQFSYHIELSPLPFLLSTIVVVLLSQLTVLSQGWKAVQRNPAETLRYQ